MMIIKRISYSNYRCFLNGTIKFTTDFKHNMSVLIAPNGAGKTEMLFSFWWTLYDFDFSTMRNKGNTPYALNSGLYRDLEKKDKDSTEKCSITLEIEDNNVIHIVTKTCEYRKTDKRISVEEYREYRTKKSNGETTIPMRDKDKIEKELQRIIPKTILNGIIFDGERMQKLSSTSENSIQAIKAVINDISNVELLERCRVYFESIKSKYNKELKRIKRKNEELTFEEIIELLDKKNIDLTNIKETNEKSLEKRDVIERELEHISEKLGKNKEVKEIENLRKNERGQLSKKEKDCDALYKSYADSLTNCYLFSTTKLLSDVQKIVDEYDVPDGLTVNAVESILGNDKNKCICGRSLDSESKKTLTQLKKLLPPDNINSTLLEICRSIEKIDIPTNKKNIIDIYKQIQKTETEIKEHKSAIAEYSTRILSIDANGEIAQEAIELEKKNNEAREMLGIILKTVVDCKEVIHEIELEIQKLQSQRDIMSQGTKLSVKLNGKINFVEKSLQALEKIKEINKNTALDDVNERLSKAYPLLSEDYERGRRIRIIQYDQRKKYQMVVYMQSDVDKTLDFWKANGSYDEKISHALSDEEINEQAIINCIDSNSTGQSKINTFAFVKAILDFSNNPKNVTGFEMKKEYPLLIDAPFGDIASDNLKKSSMELHNFSHQVILLIDEDKYDNLKNAFEPYISDKYYFTKVDKKNYSKIERVD